MEVNRTNRTAEGIFYHVCKKNGIEGMKILKPMANKGKVHILDGG
jgi:hypothetical protein